MRAPSALLAVVLLALAACSFDEPNAASNDPATPATTAPPAGSPREDTSGGRGGTRVDATLTGRIVDREGAPVAGAPVVVLRDRSGGGLAATFTAVFSLGIACVASPGSCRGAAEPADSATTDPDGRYSLTLPDAYRAGYETDDDWTLQVGRAPAAGELTGPSSSYELEVNTPVQEAPDLVLWDAAPAVRAAGALLEVRVPPLTAGGALDGGAPRFVDDRGDVVWRVTGRTVDPRLLEDGPTRLVAAATGRVTVRHRDGRTIYHQAVATAAVAHVGDQVPLSRGAPCAASDGGLVGCPFTDGELAPTGAEELSEGASATVDLGAPVEVGLVVVRGSGSHLRDDTVVEGSVDGRTWAPLPHRELSGAPGWSAGPEAGEGIPSIRYLRVTGPQQLAEISAWPPTAADRAVADGRRADGGTPGRSGRGPAAVLALVLLLAVGAGGMALRRGARGS